jgi:hypothetical protein
MQDPSASQMRPCLDCLVGPSVPRAECLSIRVDRKLNFADVIHVLSDQFILRGVPEHIRSDKVFVAKSVQDWTGAGQDGLH